MAKRSKKRGRQSADVLRDDGQRYFDGGNYAGAIQAWEKLGNKSPTKLPVAHLAEAHFRRGLELVYRQGDGADPEAGLRDLQRAVELLPSESRYLLHLGLAAHHRGDLELAVTCYRKARLKPGEFADRAAYPLAVALVSEGADLEADPVWASLSAREQGRLRYAVAFRRRPYTVPESAPALLRALAALDQGEPDEARSLLRQALAAASPALEAGTTHYYLGVIAAQEEDWGLAVQEWRAAKVAGFGSAHLYENLAEVLHRLAEESAQTGDVSGALAAAEEAAQYGSPGNALQRLLSTLYQSRGYQAAQLGRWDVAEAYWKKAQAADGGSFRLAYNRALTYERTERFHEAGEAWREALRRRPRSADHPDAIAEVQVSRLWRQAATAYIQAGEYDEAIQVCRTAVKWDPDNLETRLMLAEGLFHGGSPYAAEGELDRILELSPDYIPALLLMAEVLSTSGSWWQSSGVTRYWTRVLELEPGNQLAREGLVDYYLDQSERALEWGALPRAIDFVEQALAVSPDDPRVLSILGGYKLRAGQREAGRAHLQRALELAGSDWAVNSLICQIMLVEEPEEAFWSTLNKVEDATEGDPPSAFYLSLLEVAIRADNVPVMEALMERAIASAPEDVPILTGIARLLVPTQYHSLAGDYLERALEAGEPQGPAHVGLVLWAMSEGDTAKARRYWRQGRAAAKKANDLEALDEINRLEELLNMPPELVSMMLTSMGSGSDPLGLFEDEFFDDEYEDDDDDPW